MHDPNKPSHMCMPPPSNPKEWKCSCGKVYRLDKKHQVYFAVDPAVLSEVLRRA